MKRWLFSAGFILLLLLAGFFYASPPVNAQTTDEDQSSATGANNNNNNNNGGTPDGTANNPWLINYTKDDFDAYNKAVSETGCSTPSLECLVRNTVRFVAIEWVQEIMGPNMYVNFDGGSVDPNDPRYGGIDKQSSTSQPGIIGSVFGLIGSMYAYQPAATNRYVAYVLDEADLAPPAYAQGVGFAALDPVLNLWKMFRNVAYFFFIGVFIVIGFMIMFRQKISGQAAITAQQAIPSIIVSLILVTFSYAIAGFLIDLMYLFMFMLVYVFNYTSGTGNSAILAASSVQWNIGELGAALMGAAWNPANNAGFVETLLSNFEGTSGGWLSNGVFSWMGGLTLSLVLAIAVLIGMVKLFFELLKSYASIIMGVIFAPFYLMLGAFPGKNTFVPWLRNMVGNLAAFPTVLLFVMLFQVFTSESVFRDGFGGGFMPPYLIGGGQSSAAAYLLGLGIILALEPIVKEIKKRMGASDGGFGMMVAGAAGASAKEAWNKGFMGVSGKSLSGLGFSSAGAGIGALTGGTINKMRGGSFGAGAKTGAIAGGVAPLVVTRTPRILNNIANTVMNQGSQAAGKVLLTGGIEKIKNIVPEGYVQRIDQFGNIILEKKREAEDPNSTSNISNAPKPNITDPSASW